MSRYGFHNLFQPIMRAGDLDVAGHETLIRLSRDGRNVSAEDIISKALKSNRLHVVDYFSAANAFSALTEDNYTRSITFNASIISLESEGYLFELEKLASSVPIQYREKVVVEITETESIKDVEKTVKAINRIQSMGLKVALDDFIGGVNGMTLLGAVATSHVKVSSSTLNEVMDAGVKGVHRPFWVLKEFVAFVNGLGAKIIIEGVETEAHLIAARSIGADYLQGYLLGKPGATLQNESSYKDPSVIALHPATYRKRRTA